MRRNIIRVIILSVLIVLCIGQTITLWLGSMTGHNFFVGATDQDVAQYCVYPEQIWVNVGVCAYKISEPNTSETRRYRLIMELVNALKREYIQVKEVSNIEYSNLLSIPGLIYQYGMTMNLEEIVGKGITKDNKSIKVKELFVDMSQNDSYKTFVYVIDESDTVQYMITINNKLIFNNETLVYFKNDITGDTDQQYKRYQASLLDTSINEKFTSNIFYPLDNKIQPINYMPITFKPAISESDMVELKNYANQLFENPVYKQAVHTETGITFFDNLNLSVKYNRVGTLEFKKSSMDTGTKLTAIERTSKVMTFIEETEAIPKALKSGLYLEQIEVDEEKDEFTYRFGYQYNNYNVLLTDRIKDRLQVNNYVELTVKNSEIISGKWMLLVPQPNNNMGFMQIITECFEMMSALLEQERVTEDMKFNRLECMYIIGDLNRVARFNWVATTNSQNIIID